jgi:hypothetical protein
MSDLSSEIISQKEVAFRTLATKREMWDKVEQLFHGQLNDQISELSGSQVFDPTLATLTIERGYRVMGQLGTGKVRGISKNDVGSAKLMNLVLDKYVVPNAKAQFDFLTKLRMVDIYSNIYGAFFVMIDWDVRPDGYVGPDMWLLNIRDVFPQVGAVSLEDSDYIITRTWRPLSYFKGLKQQDGFKNLSDIISKLERMSGSKHVRKSDDMSKREENEYLDREVAKGMGYFEVLSRFERDRWVDVVADVDEIFRDKKNPHDDGDLPIKCKYSIPLLDDFMGMADMERGASMQMTKNSIWNLYLRGVRLSIDPPMAFDKSMIASESSIRRIPGVSWMFRGSPANAMTPVNLSPQGIQTFQSVNQSVNAAILNIFGTSDTTVSKDVDNTQGKTPQALQMQQARENTRDAADRYYMETFVSSVMKKMANLIVKKQSSVIAIRMFGDEIDELAKDNPEIMDMYDEKSGKLAIGKSKTGSTLYDYEITPGSTYALDQKAQQENLQSLLALYLQSNTPQGNLLVAQLAQEGFDLHFGELFKRVVANSGIQDWDKILSEKSEQEKGDAVIQQNAMQLEQAMMQMGNNMNTIPAQPQQGQPMGGMGEQMGGMV